MVTLADLFGMNAEKKMGQIVKLGYGKANFPGTLATYGAFKVSPPFARVTAITSGKRHGNQDNQPVGTLEHMGALISQQVEHENGTILLFTCKWQRGPQLLREGAVFIRLRHGAPLWELIASVPTHHNNVCGDSFSMFAGYGDVMTTDELKLYDIDISRGFVSRFMDEDELNECFRLVQLRKESVPRPSVTAIITPAGVEMQEVAQAPRRRLIVKPRG